MSVSADTVFHFTNSHDRLINILRHTFKPRYCWEDYSTIEPDFSREHPNVAFPMVSFCDIPLSQVTNHVNTYGRYGIGLKKSWAIQKGMNPVFYAKAGTRAVTALRNAANGIISSDIEVGSDFDKVAGYFNEFIPYIKLYKGRLYRNGGYREDKVTFYDEREWRHVPEPRAIAACAAKNYITWDEHIADPDLFERCNNLIGQSCKLHFEPDDINYLIVASEADVLVTVNAIDEIKASFSDDQRKTLTTRIISMEQIVRDF